VTIHADSRYQVPEILAGTNAVGAVDGGFFSLKFLDSNVMIGPVLSQSTRQFVPGNASENPRLNGRPLILIAPNQVSFVPFDAAQHNTLAGIYSALPGVTDAFVGAAWLVKDGHPQPASSFGTLFDFDARRHRAFWGINQAGQPVIGVSHTMVDSVELGILLHQAGLRDAVMLDSGASTSLAFRGESLVGYEPRPVPHVVALIPPEANDGSPCPLVMPGAALALE
ncbi:MAG: phosphodiester glycosidase family protein, partial [Leptolyngbyaceae cyanobacterium SM2_5_2]|nr:phosphodiester glycosidase family protein [Leptolyngbyaceae cyanobacterium SM2_5_2]